MSEAPEVAAAGGVRVRLLDPAVQRAAAPAYARAVADRVPEGLLARDASLWGPAAAAEAAHRLGWVDLPRTSRALLDRVGALRDTYRGRGADHVVLAGMGGSSLAPEVIAAAWGVPLTVLDTTDPGQVRRALADRLDRTVLVVASKSGGTVETDSHRRVYEQAFRDAGIDPAQRVVVVTDPGSPLAALAADSGYPTVLADPDVGGRYSALTAFGLVPSGLAGADPAALLDAAAALLPALGAGRDNPGLLLGAALGGAGVVGRDKVVLHAEDPPGFGDWAEQLVAESTGKQGRGLLPVVVEGPGHGLGDGPVEGRDLPGLAPAPDSHRVLVASALGSDPDPMADTEVTGPLGAQFLLWEYAVAVAGRVLGINPFDQPNVAESKENTARLLAAGDGPPGRPALVDGPVEVYGDPALLGGATDLPAALRALAAAVPPRGYLAVLAYLDRGADAAAASLRPLLARALGDRPVTFGWGPRCLHSTGQYHKGGPPVGAFLQVTGVVVDDLAVPGRPYTFGRLQAAQAAGDLDALARRGRPVLRVHLRDRAAGLAVLRAAAGSLTVPAPGRP